jgi:tetratricopeptide (TPR) repeat protein
VVLSHDEDDVQALFERGSLYLLLKDPYAALADFNRLIELEPDFACAYNKRGEAYLLLGDLQRADADCQRGWQLDDTHVEHGWKVQWLAMCQTQPDAAMPTRLEQIASTDTADYYAYLCRAVALYLRGEYQQALLELDEAQRLCDEGWDAHFWSGLILAMSGRDTEAIATLRQALALGMPPLLQAPLRWLSEMHPDFYRTHALPLLMAQ